MKKISLLLLLCLMLLSGCTDQRETDSLSIISGAAVDFSEKGYRITHELVGLQEEGKVTPRFIASEGASLLSAGRAAQAQTGRTFYYGHAQSLVISEDVAKQGVAAIVDFTSRQKSIALSLRPLISRADTAADLLLPQPSTEDLASYEFSKMAGGSSPSSAVIDMPFYHFQSDLNEVGIDPVLPAANVMNDPKDEPNAYFDGTAIFREDRLVGFLDTPQTRLLLLMRNARQEGLLEMASEDVSFTLFRSRCKIIPQWNDGKPSAVVRLSVRARLAEEESTVFESAEQAEALCAETLQKQLAEALAVLQQEYRADSIGIGRTFSKKMPRQWKELSQNWRSIYPTLPIQVEVDCTLGGSGRTMLKGVK